VRYTDPSGHNPECGPDGIFCDPSTSFEEKYGITLVDFIAEEDIQAVRSAVIAVARKFGAILGNNPALAWMKTFGFMKFQIGGCDKCAEGEVGAFTYGAHEIRFTGLSDQSHLKRRNHVVHEIGHAFNWLILGITGIDIYQELRDWRNEHPGFPDRQAYTGDGGPGPGWGFAGPQNQFTWQQSNEGGDNEEFADQFLGWTYNEWETGNNGGIVPAGQFRSDMMNMNMPLWVDMAANR
jgi:hypothetical protein